jgi:hypothetical protein
MVLNARCRAIVIGCGVLSIFARGAVAEETPRLEPGAWVRVTVTEQGAEVGDAQRIKGPVVVLGDRTLTLRRGSKPDQVVIPREDIALLEARVRKGRRLMGMTVGLVAGATIGAGIGLSAGDDPEPPTNIGDIALSSAEKAVALGAALGLAGAVVGAIVAPGEEWKTISLESVGREVGVRVTPSGHVVIGISF